MASRQNLGINGLQVLKSKVADAGMIEQNNLTNILGKKEAEILTSNIVMAAQMGEDLAQGALGLSYLTQGVNGASKIKTKAKPDIRLIGKSDFEWYIMGSFFRSIPIIGYRNAQDNTAPGKRKTTFELEFGEKWFNSNDIIASGEYKDQLLFANDEPYEENGSWFVPVEIVGGTELDSYPLEFLRGGAKFFKGSSAFGEYSTGGGSQHVFPTKMSGHMTLSRTSDVITGHATATNTIIKFLNPKTGNPESYWVDGIMWQHICRFLSEIEWNKWYGIDNRDEYGNVRMTDSSGYPTPTAAGVLQQLSGSPAVTYPIGGLNMQRLRMFLGKLFINSGGKRNQQYVVFCGQGFRQDFNYAIRAEINNLGLVTDGGKFITGSGSEMGLQGGFTMYENWDGNKLILADLPFLDNVQYNTKLNPKSGLPMESHQGIVLDFSMYGGEPNIQHVSRGANGYDRSMQAWYVPGGTTPTPTAPGMSWSNNMRASGIDGYSTHILSEYAVIVKNVLSCGRIMCK
jgi:hypothetical protein